MAHILKCKYCGETMDIDVVPVRKIGTRYAHLNCTEYTLNQDAQREKLREYINLLFKGDVDWSRVGKQINMFNNQGYTLKGIYYTLQYLYVIKKEDIKKANRGIGIIPYKYNEAREYYRREHNTYTIAKKVSENTIKVKTKTTSQILISKKKEEEKKKKLLNMDF